MPLLTSLLPCQELWALGEQLYSCMAAVTAPFAVISPLRKNSQLVEGARLVLSKCLGESSALRNGTQVPQRSSGSLVLPGGRGCIPPSLQAVALWLHFVPPFLLSSQNHGIIQVGKEPQDHRVQPFPPHCQAHHQPTSPRAKSARLLNPQGWGNDPHRDHLHPAVLAPAPPRIPAPPRWQRADPGARSAPSPGPGGLSPVPVPVHGPRAPSSTACGIGTGNRPGTSRGTAESQDPLRWKSPPRPPSPTAPPALPMPPLSRVSPRATFTRLLKAKVKRLPTAREQGYIRNWEADCPSEL